MYRWEPDLPADCDGELIAAIRVMGTEPAAPLPRRPAAEQPRGGHVGRWELADPETLARVRAALLLLPPFP